MPVDDKTKVSCLGKGEMEEDQDWMLDWSSALIKALKYEDEFNSKHQDEKVNIEDYLCK